MNISQSKLENAVKNKMTSGYLAMDSKNTILWGSLTALFISSNVITYTSAYNGGWEGHILAQKTTIATMVSYKKLEDEMIDRYEKEYLQRRINKDINPVSTPYSYIDQWGDSQNIPNTAPSPAFN